MKTFTVAFDCDGTLKNYDGSLNPEMVNLLTYFVRSGAKVIVWSGGGKDYARGVLRKIIDEKKEIFDTICASDFPLFMAKDPNVKPDLTFDDQAVSLGNFNCQIQFNGW